MKRLIKRLGGIDGIDILLFTAFWWLLTGLLLNVIELIEWIRD